MGSSGREADGSGGQRGEKTARPAAEANVRLAMKSRLSVIEWHSFGFPYAY
jgi:hypothetical protein